MLVLLTIALLVALFGVIRPFKGIQRKHFGMAAAALFVACLIATPDPKDLNRAAPAPKSLSPEEQKALREKNKVEIATLQREAKAMPTTDLEGNSRVYSRLAELDPSSTQFAERRDHYRKLVEDSAAFADKPETALEIVKFDWNKDGFSSIMMVDATVQNHAPFPIKDFELHCVHQGPSGTDMDRNTRTVYEIVPARGSKRVREINMGFIHSQVATSRCEITDAVKV